LSATSMKPSNPVVKLGYALANLAVQEYQRSAAALRQALTLHPEWYSTPPALITFYTDSGAFNIQLTQLEQFAEKNSTHVEARFLLGYLYLMNGQIDQSVQVLDWVVKQDTDDQQASRLLGILAGKQNKPNS